MRFPKKMPIQLSSNFLLATNFFLGEKNISQYGLGLQGSEEYLQCLHLNKVIIKRTDSRAKQLVPIFFSTCGYNKYTTSWPPIVTVLCCTVLRSLTPHRASRSMLDALDAGVIERSSVMVYVVVPTTNPLLGVPNASPLFLTCGISSFMYVRIVAQEVGLNWDFLKFLTSP